MNQPFLNSTRCVISTLTPVHMGSGDDYYPTNYVIDGGWLHHFSEEGLLQAATADERRQLAQLAVFKGKAEEGIKRLQAFIYEKRDRFLAHATHRVPLSDQLDHFYRSRTGKITQREGNGNGRNNQLEIQRCSVNPYDQQPILPGSGIKGATRTALLDGANDGRAPNDFERDPNRKPPRWASDRLQQRLLDYEKIPDDPLRLLKIGDAAYRLPDGLLGLEIRVAVNRKKKRSKSRSQAEDKGLSTLLESLPAHRSRALGCEITFLDSARRAIPGMDNLRELADCCNAFYRPQLERELALLRDLNHADAAWIGAVERLSSGEWCQAFDRKRAFLLRLGRHGGAESNTLNGVRWIWIPQIKKSQDHTNTYWLAADHKDQQHGLLPFGWVLVELGDAGLVETHRFLQERCAADYDRLAEEQRREAEAAARRRELAEQAEVKVRAEREAAAAEQAER
jgi:CRISPR-associated protein Csm5